MRILLFSLYFLSCSLAFAYPVIHATPPADTPPTSDDGITRKTWPRPQAQSVQVVQAAPVQPRQEARRSGGVSRRAQEQFAWEYLAPEVQAAALQQAQEVAARRAERLAWLIMPPGGARWASLGIYLANLFGTTGGAAPYSTGFGADVTIWPTPWAIFLHGRVGALYQAGVAAPNFHQLGVDVEGAVGYSFGNLVALRLGWAGTRNTWGTATGQGATLSVADQALWQHSFLAGVGVTIRGVTLGAECRVGAAVGLTTAGVALSSGTAGACGFGMTGSLFTL